MKEFGKIRGRSNYVRFQAVVELRQRYPKNVMKRETEATESIDKMRDYLLPKGKYREILARIPLEMVGMEFRTMRSSLPTP